MNKKFSTLLTMGLLLASSLSSVSAEEFQKKFMGDPADKVEGGKYILVQNGKAIGFSNYSWNDNTVVLSRIALSTDESEIENYKDFVWVVSESTQLEKTIYKLTNAAYNLALYVDKATGSTIITDFDDVDNTYSAEWAWNSAFTSYEKKGDNGAYLLPALAALNNRDNGVIDWATGESATADATTNAIKLYKVKDVAADADALNMLYNTNGFNFALTTSGVDNIFADQKVKAIKLTRDFVREYVDEEPIQGFPAGTYFVVNAPANVNFGDLDTWQKQYDYLLNSTFIAVSPTECAANADKRKEGQGFKLVTVSGKDLNQFIGESRGVLHDYADKLTSGAEVSVYNAAFNVYEDFEGSKYALSLDNVRFESVAGAGTHAQKPLRIDILTDLNVVAGKTLATQSAGASKFIFKFVQPVTVTPKELLNNEGASIFNIQFGNTVAKGAYLTENYDYWTERYEVDGEIETYEREGIRYYTKGDVLADLNDPAFQYVITNVDGVNYTFTNRETQNSFVAQLYKEEDGCYSLFIDDYYSLATILDYNTQNGVYPNETKSWTYLNGAHVKLLPAASTDKFNTYWTADSETLVTLAFARDNTPTSNKMYPAVEYNQSGYFTGNLEDEMTDDVTKAAQWQLVKAFNAPKYQTTTYAYLDKNDKVVYKTEGDTIAAYGYKLELIADGNPTNYFLYRGLDGSYNVAWDQATYFHIKDNVDGSVSLFSPLSGYNTYLAVENHDGYPQADFDDELDRKMIQANKSMTYPSYDIKTYLIQDAPEISLPIETTFVTMQSEMGNYISMNEAQDGILVNLEPSTFKVFATDSAKAVPSFYVTFGKNEDSSRAYMFNPVDSVNYYVGAGAYDKKYEWSEGVRKVIFKDAILNETADTLTTSIKGKVANVAMAADRKGTQAGLDKFKFQIVKADPAEDAYIIRQNGNYLRALNGKLTFGNRTQAVLLNIENTTAPTANAAIEAAGVQVIGGEGVVTVQGAAGKVITVANILGQTIANQVAASDNVTIAVPAGIVVVAVDGEATKVVVK